MSEAAGAVMGCNTVFVGSGDALVVFDSVAGVSVLLLFVSTMSLVASSWIASPLYALSDTSRFEYLGRTYRFDWGVNDLTFPTEYKRRIACVMTRSAVF